MASKAGHCFAGKLATLALNGNRIVSVAQELGQCSQLRNLALQANNIRELPEKITQLHVSHSKPLAQTQNFQCYYMVQ